MRCFRETILLLCDVLPTLPFHYAWFAYAVLPRSFRGASAKLRTIEALVVDITSKKQKELFRTLIVRHLDFDIHQKMKELFTTSPTAIIYDLF